MKPRLGSFQALAGVLLLIMSAACNAGSEEPGLDATISPSPGAITEHFSGIFPIGFADVARDLQDMADVGEPPRGNDPLSVAAGAADQYCGWDFDNGLEARLVSQQGSPGEGWQAQVSLRPIIGEDPGILGEDHIVRLFGFEGAEDPVWFASAIQSSQIVVEEPAEASTIQSPVRVLGEGVGFEGTIQTYLLDDYGRILHQGFVNAGAMSIEPFDDELTFDIAGTPQGVLVLRSAAGAGPDPNCTAQRVNFDDFDD